MSAWRTRGRGLRRTAGTAAVAIVAALGAVVAAPDAQAQPRPAAVPAARPASAAIANAAAKARSTGKPVEVSALTTPTGQMFANPNGTVTLTTSAQPVRVKRGGTWVGLDATLARNSDGSYSPKASSVSLHLSGGGNTPLARITDGGTELSLSWPTALPTPTASGDHLTYPGVFPGVDLVVTATVQGGFSEVLVVRDAAAAANPALASLDLPITTKGLKLATGSAGNITATDPNGRLAVTAPAAMMWDSTTPSTAHSAAASSVPDPDAASSHRGPGVAARRAVVKTAVSGGKLHLTADRNLLNSAGTKWPVYIDPSFNPSPALASRAAWTYVNSYYADQPYWNANDVARVGYNGWDSPYFVAQSFFRFSIPSAIWSANIISATLQTKVVWSPNTNTADVLLYRTSAISSGTTWNTRPSQQLKIDEQAVAAHYSTDTNYPVQEFNMTGEIAAAAAGHWTTATVGLYSNDPSNRDLWRKFDNNPTIAITYNTPPNVPSSAVTSPQTDCNASPYSAVGNTAVAISATLSDPDGTQNQLDGQFVLTDDTTGTTIATPTQTVANGTTAAVGFAASTFTDGHTYSWKVRAFDGRDYSQYTTTCHFVSDKTAPKAPTITSSTYPTGQDGPPARTPGNFTFTPAAGEAPASYVYRLNVPPDTTVPAAPGTYPGGTRVAAAADGAPTTLSITPKRVGPNILYVYATDRAGNISANATYSFSAAPLTSPDPAGDFTGDGKPDFLAVGPAHRPGLWLYAGTNTGGAIGPSAAQVGGYGTGGPGGAGNAGDWTGATVSPGNLTDEGMQDILVRLPHGDPQAGNVEFIEGTGDGLPFRSTPDRVHPVTLTNIDSTNTAYQTVDQIVASATPGFYSDPDFTRPADLYAVVGDSLYVYLAQFDGYSDPYNLGSGWKSRTITATRSGANAALYSRDNTTGELDLWVVTAGADGNPVIGQPTKVSTAFATADVPLIAGADINIDTKPDLWAVTKAGEVKAYLAGSFGSPAATNQVSFWTTVTGDFNGDARADAGLLYDYGNGHVAAFSLPAHANGDGGFNDPSSLWDNPTWGYGTKFTAKGDFNGDGKADIALFFDYGGGHVSIFDLIAHSNGDGRFDGPYRAWDGPYWGSATSLMSAGDVNGDGKDDIALGYQYDSSHFSVFTLTAHANGDGGFNSPYRAWDGPYWGPGTSFMSAGDFNGDGKADTALFYDYGGGHVALFTLTAHANGDGGFNDPYNRWENPTWGYGTKFMSAGDLNGDGKTDIALFFDYGGGHVSLFTLTAHANGDGGLNSPYRAWDGPYWGSGTMFMSTGDFNGDTYADVALFYDYYTGGHVALFTLPGHADGSLTAPNAAGWDGPYWGTGTRAMF